MKLIAFCQIVLATSLVTGCGGDEEKTLVEKGKDLFEKGTFNGNGTTCASCHNATTGSLTPADVQALRAKNPKDPLFQHDRADTFGGTNFDRLAQHATILVELPLPANVRIVGSDARSVVVARGIPTTMNTPALDDMLMLDGRQTTLEGQAEDAIRGHMQGTAKPEEIAAIAAFEATLFNRENLREFFTNGTPLTMPMGTTDEEKRGRRWFIADDQTDPDQVGETTDSVCGWCHSGPFLNKGSAFFGNNITATVAPEGVRYMSVRVSDFNTIQNPTYMWEISDPMTGAVLRTAMSPDPGAVLITGNNGHFNAFKSTTLWGTKDTAPYFHDNSAKDMDEMMKHYGDALKSLSMANPKVGRIIDLTDQEKADIKAYLMLL